MALAGHRVLFSRSTRRHNVQVVQVDESEARTEFLRQLGSYSPRAQHVAGVAARAAELAATVPPGDGDLLVVAAWLHDIGYAAKVAETGFHPLDGARHLRSLGAPPRLCNLVANHTNAPVEAEARGLGKALAEEFPAEHSATADALAYADLTTSPDGSKVTVEERIAEIYERYEPGHVVHEAIRTSEQQLIATVRRVEARLAAAHPR